MADEEFRGYCSTSDRLGVDRPGLFQAASLRGKTWEPGRTLRVLLLDGPRDFHDRVATHVQSWEDHAGIRFQLVRDGIGEIRLTFTAMPGRFYSMIGNDALLGGFAPNNHTMNLGFPSTWPLGTAAVEREIRRLILHEFGHALGLIHEHSSPEAGNLFKNRELVYAYYARTQGWDRATVDENVLKVYSRGQISNSTAFDPFSIMLYQVPPEITDRPTQINYELSELDRKLIGELYPKTSGPPSPPPTPKPPVSHLPIGRALQLGVPLETVHAVRETIDIYHIVVPTPGTYDIQTTGEFAWTITLFSAEQPDQVIRHDQGSGQGLNARILQQLRPGIYYLAVRPVLPELTGRYGILFRRATAP